MTIDNQRVNTAVEALVDAIQGSRTDGLSVAEMQHTLYHRIGPWQSCERIPDTVWVRRNGLGQVVATVDGWLQLNYINETFQDVHHPQFVAWAVKVMEHGQTTSYRSKGGYEKARKKDWTKIGMVLEARQKADAALRKLIVGLPGPWKIED